MNKLLAVLLCMVALPAFGATCKISEYSQQIEDDSGEVTPVAREPAVTVQTVTYTTTTQSTAFNNSTHFVRIVCDAKAHFEFGTNPTATANDPYVAADTVEYFGVTPGASIEVAFYDGSS